MLSPKLGVKDFRFDPVAIHVGDPGYRIPGPFARVGEAANHADLVIRGLGAHRQADWMLVGQAALAYQIVRIRLADDSRRAFAILPLHALDPQLGRLDDVGIGGYHLECGNLIHFDYLRPAWSFARSYRAPDHRSIQAGESRPPPDSGLQGQLRDALFYWPCAAGGLAIN